MQINEAYLEFIMMKIRILDASIRPTIISFKAEVALIVGLITGAVFNGDQFFVFTAIITITVNHSSFVDLFTSKQTGSVFS